MKHDPFRLSVAISIAFVLFVSAEQISFQLAGKGDGVAIVATTILLFLQCLVSSLNLFFLVRSSPTRRVWLDLLVAAASCGCISIVFYLLSRALPGVFSGDPFASTSFMQRIWISFYGGVVFASIVCPIGWYFERVRREEAKRIVLEQMRLDNLLAQLNSMQQQMNPDFLLDSLHVLKAGTSDEWTREYVAELAGIYRYLLTLNHESCVVRLDEELRFTHAYIHILRQRFEEGLDLDVDVRPGGDDRYIPPLALQTVVENAVKHNSLSHDAPLRIRVFEEADKIVVENNLLPPPFEQKSGSTGIGLRNLKERYRLIGGLSPLISKGEGAFTVKLPLLPEPAGM